MLFYSRILAKFCTYSIFLRFMRNLFLYSSSSQLKVTNTQWRLPAYAWHRLSSTNTTSRADRNY